MLPIGDNFFELYEANYVAKGGKVKKQGRPKAAPKSTKQFSPIPSWEEHIEVTYGCKCFNCPGLYANELMNFVGFRGKQTKITKGHAKGFLNELDIRGKMFEGEAHPVPIVPITKHNVENLKRLT